MANENHSVRLSAAAVLAMVLGSYLFAADADASGTRDVSRINGSVEVAADEHVGDVSSINGRIEIERNAVAGEVDTINGRIEVQSGARIHSAETVNGRISLDNNVAVSDSLETVNGSIRTRGGSEIGDTVSTVNGDIDLQQTRIGGDVKTANGDIELRQGSVVEGDVIVRGSRSWLTRLFSFGHHRPTELRIDASSKVMGDIHLYREVDLRIDDDAEVGEVFHHY